MINATLNMSGVHLDTNRHAIVKSDTQRLRATHAAESAGEGDCALQGRFVPMLLRQRGEGFICPLQDALGADVDPRTRGHLPVHHQAFFVEFVEMFPSRPATDQVRVGDQYTWRVFVGGEHADRFARLDEQRLVIFETFQLTDDIINIIPGTCGFSTSAVDDQFFRLLCVIGHQVVQQHTFRGFLDPAFAGSGGSGRGSDGVAVTHINSPWEYSFVWPGFLVWSGNYTWPGL
ncbi:hypothetical protein BMS3Bbin04_01488 [bacterium BMS3Bbin04]|nr:hypothetical protein BMS3Bbin04_01488 [bacterium BMS3Bbin04]